MKFRNVTFSPVAEVIKNWIDDELYIGGKVFLGEKSKHILELFSAYFFYLVAFVKNNPFELT